MHIESTVQGQQRIRKVQQKIVENKNMADSLIVVTPIRYLLNKQNVKCVSGSTQTRQVNTDNARHIEMSPRSIQVGHTGFTKFTVDLNKEIINDSKFFSLWRTVFRQINGKDAY